MLPCRYIFWCNFSVNYHGCKEELINLIPHYLIDIIFKIVAKAITFRKIVIVLNGNKLMFQVIFLFSDWILIEQIIASSHPFCLGGNRFSKTSTSSFERRGTGAWFSRNVKTINWKVFPAHVGIYKSEKIQQAFWRGKTLTSLKKYKRMYPWG